MIDRSHLFRLAWQAARHTHSRQGTPLRQAFAQSLRDAWAILKAADRAAAALKAQTEAMITETRGLLAAGVKLAATRPWRFANAHPMGGM